MPLYLFLCRLFVVAGNGPPVMDNGPPLLCCWLSGLYSVLAYSILCGTLHPYWMQFSPQWQSSPQLRLIVDFVDAAVVYVVVLWRAKGSAMVLAVIEA
jgi:hypothetical protein